MSLAANAHVMRLLSTIWSSVCRFQLWRRESESDISLALPAGCPLHIQHRLCYPAGHDVPIDFFVVLLFVADAHTSKATGDCIARVLAVGLSILGGQMQPWNSNNLEESQLYLSEQWFAQRRTTQQLPHPSPFQDTFAWGLPRVCVRVTMRRSQRRG